MDDYGMKVQATVDLPSVKKVDEQIRALEKNISKLKVSGQFDDSALKNLTNQLNTLKANIGTATFSSSALNELTTQVEKALSNINISGTNIRKEITKNIKDNIDAGIVSQINKISDSSTSTIVQNEKKKQEAYKATSDAVVYHAGVISKLNKAETNGRFYGSSRGTGYFGTGHYFVDSNTKHELDNNSSYSKLPYTSVDISKYDNLFKATTDEIAGKLHSFLENLTRFTQGSDSFNINELFSQFKNVFTDTTMDIKDFGDKMEQLKSFMSNSNLSDRSDSVSTQFMKSLGYGGVDTRGTKYADTRYGTVIYDLKEESILQANITDELQKQSQMLEKINYEKGQVFDSSADAKIQEQIDAQNRLLEVKEEFKRSFDSSNLNFSQSEFDTAQKRLFEIDNIISDCKYQIDHADEAAKKFARDMADLGLEVSDEEMKNWKQDTATSYQKRIEELSLERAELEKRIPVLEENYNKESQLASEAYKQVQQVVEQRRLEAQQSSTTTNEVIQNEEKKQQAIQENIKLQSELASFNEKFKETGISTINNDGVVDMKKSLEEVRNIYSDFGKVTIKNEMSDLVKGTEQFRVSIESSNGELKRTESFLMKLSEDGKSFVFADDMIRSSESTVRHLNEQQEAANKVILEEEKLANKMADVREKSEQARQAEEKRQELAQSKVINRALEDEYKQRQKLADQVHEIQLLSNGGIKNDYATQLAVLEGRLSKLGLQETEITAKTQKVNDAFNDLKKRLSQPFDEKNFQEIIDLNNTLQKELIESQNELTRLSASIKMATDSSRLNNVTQMQKWADNNGKAMKKWGTVINDIIAKMGDLTVPMPKLESDQLLNSFRKIKNEAIETGNVGMTTAQKFKNAWDKIGGWSLVTGAFTKLIHTGRQMYDAVYDIDTAMTNLYKVTDETSQKYNQFLESSSKSAHELGRSISSLVEQTANWAKLGFSLDEAEQLAKISSVYANVGEVNDDTAVSDLVTAMKAFNIEATDSITIVDSLNKLGNEFATDAASLGEGLSKSASALHLAGNDINETLAMLTGGTEITQNASEMGNALKVLSMRIRGKLLCLHTRKVCMQCYA